jgi:WD40 repeat protein
MSLAPAAEAARGASRPPSPYVGLVPYDVGDAAFFFGRSTEVGIVVANLRSAPLTILYGPSGVGKSSLLMAGAVHDLCEEARTAAAESPFAVCVFNSWREDPLDGLREAAREALRELADPEPLPPPAATLAETLRAWTESSGMLLAILDQFEEYFQYHPDEGSDDRLTGFAVELARIVNDPSLPVHILLSIREDAWAKLDLFEGHIASLFGNYVRVDHLDLASAREAIEGPIAAWNRSLPGGELPFEIEPALVEAVLDATAGGSLTLTAGGETPAAETSGDRVEAPFLQLVLERLWRDAVADEAHTLTLARLEALGGARRIVANHLLDALARLTPAEQDVAADCFKVLVSSSKTKFARPVSDLAEITRRPEAEVSAVLDKLCSAESGRILRAIAPAQDEGSTSYELFHDILAEPIIAWRKEYELRRKQEAEEQRVREEQEAEEQRQQAARRRRRRLLAVLALGLLVPVFAGLAIFAFWSRIDARRAERSAASLALTLSANEQPASHVDVSLLLSLEAYRARPTAEATSSMISALEEARQYGVSAILHGVQGSVTGVAFSSDGRTLAAVAGSDGTVQLWDVRKQKQLGQPLKVVDSGVLVLGAALSPDGHTLAVIGSDGTVQLWDKGTSRYERHGEPLHVGIVNNAAFSSDGSTLGVVASSDGKVRLWNVSSSPYKPLAAPLNVGIVNGVAVSPDGHTLAVVGGDAKVQLWDVDKQTQLGPRLDMGIVDSAAFSSDGRTLAVVASGKVQLWDVRTQKRLGQPLAIPSVTGVAFSPIGHALAVARAGRVWLLETAAAEPRQLRGPQATQVNGVAVSSDGTLAVAGSDGKVRLWNVSSSPYRALANPLDVGNVNGVAVSPDGHTLAVFGGYGKVRLWDVSTSPYKQLGQPLDVGVGAVNSVVFSPDGRTLAVASNGTEVRLWDVSTSPYKQLGQPLDVGVGAVNSVVFSPDGDTLAVSGSDGTVQLWDVGTRALLGQPLHVGDAGGATTGVAFSPDGRTLAVASNGTEVRLWDVRTRTPIGKLLPGVNGVNGVKGVAVSSDGMVASGSYGSTVSLWEDVFWKDEDTLKKQVCDLVWGALGRPEWEALIPGLGYRASCD